MTDSARPDSSPERRYSTSRKAPMRDNSAPERRRSVRGSQAGKSSVPFMAKVAAVGHHVPWPTKKRNRKLAAAALASGSLLTTAALVSTITGITPAEALNGVDVSSHQHPGGQAIDWDAVKADGQSFAFIKATEGIGYLNPSFISDSQKAAAAGLTVGSYHYARPGGDARAEARYYANSLISAPQPSLPPVLDLEESGGLSTPQLQQWVREWVNEIEIQTGRTPIMYTYVSFWRNQMGNTKEFSDLPLWLAYYNSSLPDSVIPGGWDHATFWQHSGSGNVDGINTTVDLNRYDGSDAQLQALAGNLNPSSPVGGVATAVKPAVDAGVASANVSNEIQHAMQTSDNAVIRDLGNHFNVPVPTSVLVAMLGVAAGTVSLSTLWTTIHDSGFGGQLTDQLVRLATLAAQGSGIPADTIQRLLSAGNDATLAQLEQALAAAVNDPAAAEQVGRAAADVALAGSSEAGIDPTEAAKAVTTATQVLGTPE